MCSGICRADYLGTNKATKKVKNRESHIWRVSKDARLFVYTMSQV